jgi:hypothetical protein
MTLCKIEKVNGCLDLNKVSKLTEAGVSKYLFSTVD